MARQGEAKRAEEPRVPQDESRPDSPNWRKRLRGLLGMVRLRRSVAWRYIVPMILICVAEIVLKRRAFNVI